MIEKAGITPAYAGKREKMLRLGGRVKDHPRLCGEKMGESGIPSVQKGSPPPMRGKAVVLCSSPRGHRITPAYAGKRPLERLPTTATRDHPRLCGEKIILICAFCQCLGSPPPMRGKAVLGDPRCHSSRDHPRLCGEKLTA